MVGLDLKRTVPPCRFCRFSFACFLAAGWAACLPSSSSLPAPGSLRLPLACLRAACGLAAWSAPFGAMRLPAKQTNQ